jgi:hypothetical protein
MTNYLSINKNMNKDTRHFIDIVKNYNLNESIIHSGLLTQPEMIRLGATGSLNKAFERYIPVDKIVGEDPQSADWTDDNGNVNQYTPGTKINSSIEVIYNLNDDVYYLQNGNHRLKQAKINNDKYIRAFIQPDRGNIGNDVKNKV